jgi:hypothetical protein
MREVVARIACEHRYVEKIFWNRGEWDPHYDGKEVGVCNDLWTKDDGGATELLEVYDGICS